MTDLAAILRSPHAGERVELFSLDATSLGDTIYYFTQAQYETAAVSFGGRTYRPLDIQASGWAVRAQGTQPRPKLRVSNVDGRFGNLIAQYGDGLGAQVERVVTFRRFLDGQPDADASMHLPPEVYRIEQKTGQNKQYVEWLLANWFDFNGIMLPRRQVLRDYCQAMPRIWNAATGSFDYTKATCPYAGAGLYDIQGNTITDPSKEVFSKQLASCCKTRFPGGPYPTWAFPGVSMTTTSS